MLSQSLLSGGTSSAQLGSQNINEAIEIPNIVTLVIKR